MSESQAKLQAQITSLRKSLADAEAKAGNLRAKLAVVEAKSTGAPAPVTGLDVLWAAAVPKSRERSSKMQCRTEWARIPKADRPTIELAVSALKKWNRSEEWKTEGYRFAPGLHRFIQRRMWEALPEGGNDPRARYNIAPTPPPGVRTAEDTAALLDFLRSPIKL